ncbi:MAG: hypothetical protein HUJ62_01465 [Streptococcus gallolyticus]|nr:hypothetical protein [Streptococcus gallolyticus]
MAEYQYKLAKKGKHICPSCGKKTFVLYVDANNQPLNESVGKCDRADNCGFHYPPRDYFKDNGQVAAKPIIRKQPVPPPVSYIPDDKFMESFAHYDRNKLYQFLLNLFSEFYDGGSRVVEAINKYCVGTSRLFDGGAVFWQIDEVGNIRTGKIMGYDESTGKRIKKPYNQFNWAHCLLYPNGDFNLSQCLFGAHLLRIGDSFKVLIVESEKTALLLDIVMQDVIVLASGGCTNLSKDKCKILFGRDVVLIPDNGQFEKWSGIANNILKPICNTCRVSKIMERDGIETGADIGDLIVDAIRNGKPIAEVLRGI